MERHCILNLILAVELALLAWIDLRKALQVLMWVVLTTLVVAARNDVWPSTTNGPAATIFTPWVRRPRRTSRAGGRT